MAENPGRSRQPRISSRPKPSWRSDSTCWSRATSSAVYRRCPDSLWCDGRIAGGWAQDPDGQIVCRFLEDVGSEAVAAADAAAARLAAVLGPVRLTARTRGQTWLEEELAAR